MRILTGIAALLLCVSPALAGEVPQATLADLGLNQMQTATDTEGLEIRGKSGSFAMVVATSLVFGQLIDPSTKNFLVGSDINMVAANSQGTAGKHHVSSLALALSTGDGNLLSLQATAGGSGIAASGLGAIAPFLVLP